MKSLKIRRWQLLLVIMILFGIFAAVGELHKGSRVITTKTNVDTASHETSLKMNSVQDNREGSMRSDNQQTSYTGGKIYYQNKVAVLTYHHLDSTESMVTITPERFKSHLEELKNNSFHVISIEDFIDFLQKKKNVPPNAVVITFDDGYESVYKYAYPLLKSEGMTATVFLIVSYIEDGTMRQPPILNWKEIMDMHHDGFSFYSHSYNSHESVFVKGKELSKLITKIPVPPSNRPETDTEYKARIRDDLTRADDILNSKLDNRLNLLCLPHGQYNQAVIDIANQSGISYLFTGVEGFNTNKSKLIKRINAGSPYMTDKLLFRKLSQGK